MCIYVFLAGEIACVVARDASQLLRADSRIRRHAR